MRVLGWQSTAREYRLHILAPHDIWCMVLRAYGDWYPYRDCCAYTSKLYRVAASQQSSDTLKGAKVTRPVDVDGGLLSGLVKLTYCNDLHPDPVICCQLQ